MTTAHTVEHGRDAFARRAWADAHAHLTAADHDAPLEPDDLERLAVASYLVGKDTAAGDAWARASYRLAQRGETRRAARCGFWLALVLLLKGDAARGGGWLARAQRLLDGHDDCPEHGYLLVPVALRQLGEGDHAGSYATHAQVTKLGERFGDPDLTVLGRLGQGEAAIEMGERAEGADLLDEVMGSVTTEPVTPIVAGLAYCAVILSCRRAFDLRRAREWTEALSRWCAAQPDLVPFRGQCLVHRSEILQLGGAWSDAMTEARRACERLADPPGQPALGMACYQRAELHRTRGELDEAEAAYHEASRAGHEPQPGLALLRLAQGRTDDAVAAIRGVADEAHDRTARSRVLGPCVEIMLAAGDVAVARAAGDELDRLAAAVDTPLLRASSAQATGSVLLAEGDAAAALGALRRAAAAWRELDAPYETARVRLLLARACRDLGDADGARTELDAARRTFDQLGARPDLARAERLARDEAPRRSGRLTPRETEVLALAASGRTNRAIAAELVISEKTVERHLSNVFTKLEVPNRAAATAYAYEHGLV